MKKIFLTTLAMSTLTLPTLAGSLSDSMDMFFGVDGLYSVNMYNMDIGEEMGIPYSTFSSDSIFGSFGLGANLGVRFLNDIYRPGIRLFYDISYDPVKLTIATGYDSVDITGDANHQFYGVGFDNYIRVSHNLKTPRGTKIDEYVLFGAEFGRMKSEYTIDEANLVIYDNANTYGFHLGYLQEYKSGLGFLITLKYLITGNEALDGVLNTKIGIRYTF